MHKVKDLAEVLKFRNIDLLETIIEVANLLEENEIRTKEGLRWKQLPESDVNVDKEALMYPKCFYGGSSGIGFFLLRLYLVTGKNQYLNKAILAADDIVGTYEKDDFFAYEKSGFDNRYKGSLTSLYNGTAGQAYFVEVLYQQLKQKGFDEIEHYHSFVIRVADDIVDAQRILKNGSGTWTETVSISADGSLGFFLVYIYELTGDLKYLDTAKRLGYYFINNARKINDAVRWYAMDTVTFGLGEDGYFPNYFYGTSGNSYLLSILYKFTKEEIFLEYARLGANYVESLAVSKGEGVLIPYNDPYCLDTFYLGNCQGPIGTSRLFRSLYKITGEDHYKEFVRKLTEGILATGAPLILSSGFWQTYTYCCGAPALLEYFLDIDEFLETEDYKTPAQDTALKLIGDSVKQGNVRKWYTAWTRLEPNVIETYSGLYHGSTGCANSLLSLYNLQHDHLDLPYYLDERWSR